MRGKQPKLYRKKAGYWVAKWAGKEWIFTVNKKKSEEQFLDKNGEHPGSLVNWMAWRARKTADVPKLTKRTTIAELAKQFLADYYLEGREETERYYRYALKRFVVSFGKFFTDEFNTAGYDAFRKTLIGLKLSPRTIRHECKAVSRMWGWGSARDLCAAIDFRGIKMPRPARSMPEPIEREQIKNKIALARKKTPALEAWLAINYLCALRPSEVCRIADGQHKIVDWPALDGRPAIKNAALEVWGKTSDRTQLLRTIPLSAEALLWLPHVKPLQQRQSKNAPTLKSMQNYYAKCARLSGVPGMPHRLRDSAATHLLALGVDPATVSLCLGHVPRGELRNYGQPSIPVLREKLALLSLK